jgi:hypothetical protein
VAGLTFSFRKEKVKIKRKISRAEHDLIQIIGVAQKTPFVYHTIIQSLVPSAAQGIYHIFSI